MGGGGTQRAARGPDSASAPPAYCESLVNRPPHKIAIAIGTLAAAFLAACGGGEPDPPDQPPAQLLAEAFANLPSSGESSIDLDLDLEGSSFLAGEASAQLEGPFRAAEGGGVPSFDLSLDAEVAGFGIDGELVSTGEDAFVVFFGENYRVGAARVSELDRRLRELAGAAQPPATLGLRIADWFRAPSYAGAEDVGGVETERIEADLDSAAVADQLGGLAKSLGAPALVTALARGAEPGVAEAWVAFEDRTIRRVRVQFPFTVPPDQLASSGGITGGAATFDVEVSDVGADVEVEPPPGGGFQPIEQLIDRLLSLANLAL